MPSALVTGASSGIGHAIAAALAQGGWDVSGVGRNPAGRVPEGVTPIAADVRDEEQAIAAVTAHRERSAGLDLLVNSAGIGIWGNVENYQTRHWDRQFEINVRGLFVITREALPLLRASRGLIVNLASVAGLQGVSGLAAYSATKHAVVGFTRSLNEELADDGIRATALCPGFVATPMTDWVHDTVPPDEMIQPEDIARIVLMLTELSPHALVPEVEIARV